MQYIMAPLEHHYDYGFGATGEAFLRAAVTLSKQEGPKLFLEHLPQNFLLRHAIELFLKSGIVIIHRKLKLPFGGRSHTSMPMVHVAGEWKPFYRVHSVAELYEHWKALITENAAKLKSFCKYNADWTVPPELDAWIVTIEKTDPQSTYYRYPTTRDAEGDKKKSSFKEKTLEQLFPPDRPEEQKVRALVVENEAGEFVRAYALDESTDRESTDALSAAELLSNFHAMMRIEITGGW